MKNINEDYISGKPVVITIDDLRTVAKDMITICGFDPTSTDGHDLDNMDGYSDALLDSLTNHMNLEGLITTLLIENKEQ